MNIYYINKLNYFIFILVAVVINYEHFVEEHSLFEFDDCLGKMEVENYCYHYPEAQPINNLNLKR